MTLNQAKRRYLSAAFLLTFSICCLQAQQRNVTGNVKDNAGEPIIGASVLVKGTTTGTITDFEGNYSINLPNGKNTLIFSYIGYTKQEIEATGNNLDVVLKEDAENLEEVVVIGYGQTVRKADLTGAVSSVSQKVLKDVPVSSAAQILTGRLAGVNITTTEGSPDADIEVRVRGGSSITQDNSPLYIVDGFEVNSISDIAPSDIQTIDVLKDASSTAIYGARGANGVIVITTKSGREGKINVDINAYAGLKRTVNQIDVLSPYEYVMYQYEIDQSTTFQNYYGKFEDLDIYKSDKGINWQDDVFGKTAWQQYYNAAISGGSKNTRFNLSFTHNNEDYTMINSGYQRTNINFKLNTKLNDHFSFNFGARLADTRTDGPSVSSGSGANTKLRNVVKYAPTRGLRAFDSTLDDEDDQNGAEASSNLINPVQDISNEYKQQKDFNQTYNFAVNYDIIKGLRFTSSVNYAYIRNDVNNVWTDGTSKSKDKGGQPVGQITNKQSVNWSNSNTLTYSNTFAKIHKLNAMIGQEISSRRTDTQTQVGEYFPLGMTAETVLSNMSMANTYKLSTSEGEPTRISSVFGRINYTLSDKYLFTFTARYDGASVFSPNHRWGFFPGGAFAWRISEEEFMSNAKDWLNNLKLRLSYGEIGNCRVNSYWRQDYTLVDITGTKTYYPNENQENAMVPSSILRNPDLGWETKISQNIGVDFGFWNNRLSGTIELYWDKNKDLIVNSPLPTASGYTTQYQNVGQTSNKGIELTLEGYIVDTKSFALSVNGNITYNKNNVDKFSNGNLNYKLYGSGWNGSAEPTTDYIVREGEPLGQMYGYVTEGFYTFDDCVWDDTNKKWTPAEGVADCTGLTGAEFGPGALKLKDIDNNEVIDDNDRTVIGCAQPLFTGGFGINANWRKVGLDFSAFFNFSIGNDVYNANKLDYSAQLLSRKYQNLISEMSLENRFTHIDPETGLNVFSGANADPERLSEINQNATIWSPLHTTTVLHSWAIEDGSFLRLNNLTIGYTFPFKVRNAMRAENFRIYATGYNLFCATRYSGQDPEVSTRRSTPLTPGVDFSAYPKARSYVIGINLTF